MCLVNSTCIDIVKNDELNSNNAQPSFLTVVIPPLVLSGWKKVAKGGGKGRGEGGGKDRGREGILQVDVHVYMCAR